MDCQILAQVTTELFWLVNKYTKKRKVCYSKVRMKAYSHGNTDQYFCVGLGRVIRQRYLRMRTSCHKTMNKNLLKGVNQQHHKNLLRSWFSCQEEQKTLEESRQESK